MAYKRIDAAQARRQVVNASHMVALVRAATVFHNGKLRGRRVDITPPEPTDGAASVLLVEARR